MKQECPLVFVWLTWLGLPGLALLLGLSQGWPAAVFVLVVGVMAQIAYLRWFSHISRWIGYGSVADVQGEGAFSAKALPRVTLYSANVCPFCPIVRARLNELRRQVPFELEEIDVTFRPQIVLEKGFRSVPIIEADGRYLVGNATSAQLATFVAQGSRDNAA